MANKKKTDIPDETLEKNQESVEIPESDDSAKFGKDQLLKSSWYSHRRDALMALLKEDEMYSHEDVNSILDEFYEKKVK